MHISFQNFCTVFLLLTKVLFGQSTTNTIDKQNELLVVFYNVENFFDIYDDPLIIDEEFTPNGIKKWNISRLQNKANNIYKTLTAAGKWKSPAIIGLAEVENKTVLEILVQQTPLQKSGYDFIHFNSPDRRGIDVALLYRKDMFIPEKTKAIRISFPFDSLLKTRDILFVNGRVFDSVPVNIFVNHWPSRYSGMQSSERNRIHVSSVLEKQIDSLFKIDRQSNVIVMGDFNDDPDNESIIKLLQPKNIFDNDTLLWNLMSYEKTNFHGSLKYRSNWHIFDQIIVSRSLFDGTNGAIVDKKYASIFAPDFLLTEDLKYMGYKPFRTYIGPQYNGGFSDHLPIMINIIPH